MKKTCIIVVALMVLISITISVTALQYKQKTLSNGDGASAEWSVGNMDTSLNVFEAQGETVIYLDICTATPTPTPTPPTTTLTPTPIFFSCKFGSFFTQEDVFDVNNKLTTATLSPVSLQLFDFNTGTVENVNIQAQWTGVGDLTKSSFTLKEKSGDFSAKFSSDSASRAASATGTINDQTLGASQFADIFNFKDVSITTIK
jgi:hypothetical protein